MQFNYFFNYKLNMPLDEREIEMDGEDISSSVWLEWKNVNCVWARDGTKRIWLSYRSSGSGHPLICTLSMLRVLCLCPNLYTLHPPGKALSTATIHSSSSWTGDVPCPPASVPLIEFDIRLPWSIHPPAAPHTFLRRSSHIIVFLEYKFHRKSNNNNNGRNRS